MPHFVIRKFHTSAPTTIARWTIHQRFLRNAVLKSAISKFPKSSVPSFRSGWPGAHTNRIGMGIAIAIFVTDGFATPVLTSASLSTFRLTLPGGAAILYGKASNPQAPLSNRSWQQAVFQFPNGTTFDLLPRAGESNAGGTEIESPSESDISPSGQYIVIGRVETGTVWTGPEKPESVLSREFCPVIEIRTGCITSDQTGEICGEGWRADQPAQWGVDDETNNVMLKRDRPSAGRLLQFIDAGQPARIVIDDDSGAENILRCDPLSFANRESYRKIAAALHAAGAHNDARLIDAELSKVDGSTVGAPASAAVVTKHRTATVSVQKATLYTAPNEANASRAYLVQNDVVTVLKQSPVGWAYVDYVNASGKHLFQWIKIDQLAIKP